MPHNRQTGLQSPRSHLLYLMVKLDWRNHPNETTLWLGQHQLCMEVKPSLHELQTKELDTDRWSLIKQLRAILRNQHSSILFWRWHKTPPFRKRLKQRLTVWYVDYISFPSFFLSNAGLMWNTRWAIFVSQPFPTDHICLMSMHWSKNFFDGG